MDTTKHRWAAVILLALAMQFLLGCATTAGNPDPYEKTNRAMYGFNDGLDTLALKPVSDAYVKVVPRDIRRGIGNGFDNLGYFEIILNDFLQTKWQQGLSDSARMGVNSTLGMVGIFDIATQWGLPSHENDFGVTLGKWSLACGGDGGPGPYIVLPLFGPSSSRDVPAIPVGIACNPLTWCGLPGKVTIPLNVTQAIDARSRAEKYFKFRDVAAVDKYVFTRDAYLQYRRNQISEGKAAPGKSIYDEDIAPTTAPATQAATSPATHPSIESASPPALQPKPLR